MNNKLENVDIWGNYIWRDNNINNFYINDAEKEKIDLWILDEIFNSVLIRIKELKTTERYKDDKKHIKIIKKIELNFKNKEEQEILKEYFKFAYTKTNLIEIRIREENNFIQDDIASDIFSQYISLKKQWKDNMSIMEELFNLFIVPWKERNPEYTNLAKAFVLFYFDDCTIFEKQ
jgi:hypothetical protein